MIHNSDACDLDDGQPCMMCAFANEVVERREREEWSVQVALDSFRRAYGLEALKALVGQLAK